MADVRFHAHPRVRAIVAVIVALGVVGVTAYRYWSAWAEEAARSQGARCDGGDAKACEARCKRKTIGACAKLGDLVEKEDPKRAAKAWEEACTRANTTHDKAERAACRKLAVLLQSGRGFDAPKPIEAAQRYRSSCDDDDPDACAALGLMLRKGEGQPRDPEHALSLFEKACNAPQGSGDACLALAQMAEAGEGTEKSEGRAAVAYARACERIGGEGCRWLVESTNDRFSDNDVESMYLKRACEGLPARECAALARRHTRLLVDASIAERACEIGDAAACTAAADEIAKDRGLPLDYGRQAKLLTKACDADHAPACVKLANLHESGHGVPIDPARAAELARKACGDKAAHDDARKRWSCPSAISLREGRTQVSGRLSEDVIKEILNRTQRRFHECWEERRIPPGKGDVKVLFVIDLRGAVANAKTISSKNVDAATSECILNVVRETVFPVPANIITVDENFTLDYGDR